MREFTRCFRLRLIRSSIALAIVLTAGTAPAEVPETVTGRIQERTYRFEPTDEDLPYSLYVPTSYRPGEPAPLIVALHGLFSNPRQIIRYRGLTRHAEEFGYVVVAPMGYNTRGWYGALGSGRRTTRDPETLGDLSEQDVLNVMQLVRDELSIDPDRIYLLGHSMGGGGALHLAMKYPELWAAIAPIAPAVPRNLPELVTARDIPAIVVQGDRDWLLGGTRRWVREMRRIGMPHRYIEVPGGGHMSVAWRHFPQIYAFFDGHSRTAAPWPRFRGPNGDGVAADDPRLPDTWSTTENVAWKAEVPGWGWSCPIVWGNRVFLTTVVSDEASEEPMGGLYLGQGVREPPPGTHHWLVICYDLETGEELWQHEPHTGRPTVPRHPKATYASETPVTDGERLYVLFGDLGLWCYDLDGDLLWEQPIEPRKTVRDYGAAASPILHDGKLFVLYDNNEDSFLAAFDAVSGDELWRTERDEPTTWATPYIWEHADRTEIVTCGLSRNRSYDLDGNLLWEFDGRMSSLVIPSPFAVDDLLFISSGYIGDDHRPVYAISPGATGDITLQPDETSNESITWYQPLGSSYNPSPIVYNGRYYTLFDRGLLTCHDASTGTEIYGRTRIGGSFTASPWAYNGKVFLLSEDGRTFVVRDGAEFELLGENDLEELCIATPAISDGRLLIRTASKLYCLTNESPVE